MQEEHQAKKFRTQFKVATYVYHWGMQVEPVVQGVTYEQATWVVK